MTSSMLPDGKATTVVIDQKQCNTKALLDRYMLPVFATVVFQRCGTPDVCTIAVALEKVLSWRFAHVACC